MNIASNNVRKLGIAVVTIALLAACASPMRTPDGAVAARQKLTQLKGERELTGLAPIEIQSAEEAVLAAENPVRDPVLTNHLVLIADRKVETARLWAQSRYYENQRDALTKASEQARLEARTQEAENARLATKIAQDNTDIARNQAAAARNEAATARTDAATARTETATARTDAATARTETEELKQQITELNARNTDRGLAVTLGDLLFATGKSTIIGANNSNLAKLAAFLNQYEERTVMIEGHTDTVGTESANMLLSRNRANAVKDYLVGEGIASSRVTAMGMGEGSPISSNETETGRQQNRRVEVIIADIPL